MRIGTWNLENLYRPGEGTTQAEYQEKVTALAATIHRMTPDILAVQEVGDPAALKDLVDLLDGAWSLCLAAPDDRGIRVGILAKSDPSVGKQFYQFPSQLAPVQVNDTGASIIRMGRPALRARFLLGEQPIDIISAHLKSKLLSYPGGRFSPRNEGERARAAVYALNRRAAEAATVRAGVDRLLKGKGQDRAVIVAGDFNDTPQAATTQVLIGPGGSEIHTVGFDRPDQGDGHRLWNLAPLIPEQERFSRIYQGRGELIDHLLVSHVLAHAVTTVRTESLDIPSIGDDPTRRTSAAGSDHRPVWADFDY